MRRRKLIVIAGTVAVLGGLLVAPLTSAQTGPGDEIPGNVSDTAPEEHGRTQSAPPVDPADPTTGGPGLVGPGDEEDAPTSGTAPAENESNTATDEPRDPADQTGG